jgi:glutamate-1-semialdehyde 2,1-aminomutase
LNEAAAGSKVPFTVTGYGSLAGLHFARSPIRSVADLPPSPELRALLHLELLEQGYSYARRGFVALSLPLEQSDVDGFAAAVESFLASLG